LLLKKSIALPSKCIEAGVVTIGELTNILAEKILTSNHGANGSDHHINETMKIFPTLQFGMDLNPKFTSGPTGVEYTLELNAFDLLQVNLVHGWLLEPDAQEYEWVGNNTYNQLVNLVIEGNDARAKLQQKSTDDNCNYDELSNQATRGTIIHNFLERSGHQLTQHGLFILYEFVKEGDMVVFFRNNHFNTLTKHKDSLYLLVTDFGYADVNSVVWEKLDVIDGDTEYVNAEFKVPPPIKHHLAGVATGEQLVANNAQSDVDYQLALQLSREPSQPSNTENSVYNSLSEHQDQHKERSDVAIASASQSYSTENLHGSPTIAVGIPMAMGEGSQEARDMMLAMQLQRQEEREGARLRQQQNRRTAQSQTKTASKDSGCVIS